MPNVNKHKIKQANELDYNKNLLDLDCAKLNPKSQFMGRGLPKPL